MSNQRLQNQYSVVELGPRSALVVCDGSTSCGREVEPGKDFFTHRRDRVIETHPQVADALAWVLGKRAAGFPLNEHEVGLIDQLREHQQAHPGKAWRPDWFAVTRNIWLKHS